MIGAYTIDSARRGFTLIELIAVILIIAVLGTIAVQKMAPLGRTLRIEETKREMNRLACAIVGNSELRNLGRRSDFGYVGDIGALPPNLDALFSNPGYATWNGPYIENAFAQIPEDFKKDSWQTDYVYSGITISSVGSGETIETKLAGSTKQILFNRVSGNLYDIDGTPPGNVYRDSVAVRLTIPDGIGGNITESASVSDGGFFSFDSIPIGNHRLEIIYLPDSDSLRRFVSVSPGSHPYGEYYFPRNIWQASGDGGSAGGIEVVAGSDTLSTTDCFRLSFWITNSGGTIIAVSSMTLTWSTPTGYYKTISWNGSDVRSGSPALGSGDVAVFVNAQNIAPGQSVKIDVEAFHDGPGGGGSPVDMTGAVMTVDFSDGSTINFTADLCSG